jgi:hypothetical protein
MPFLTDDGRPLDELLLAQRPADGYLFEVREGFVYDDPASGRQYRVPAKAAPTAPTSGPPSPTTAATIRSGLSKAAPKACDST